ncbi:DNA-binding FrmR family transcriptional regulator [Paraburkholderia silvatlantica]|nr:DNA-binding FrmR family transcriptional regulator [Paraburkholderia silvatlantica]PXW42567.1 DNA-binding FrmR family transcriptional regulator [Paraburkholderia silvatlantica]
MGPLCAAHLEGTAPIFIWHHADNITAKRILPASIRLYYPAVSSIDAVMPHSPEEKKRVLTRVRKVRGQLDALERALEEGADCAPVLQQLAAIRGAINGVMAGVLESHLREEFTHLAGSAESPGSIDDVVTLVRTYLR